MKIISRLFLSAVLMLSPVLVMAHGDHQHIGGTLALVEHLAEHIDYLVVALLAVVGIILWIKTPDA